MDIILRNATVADSERISEIVSSLALKHIGPTLGEGGIDPLLASMDAEQTRMRIENQWLHLCAMRGDDMIGVVVVKPQSHLYHLFVQTEFQRKGIGTKLFTAADDATLASTNSRLTTVNSSLNVVPAYERFGFTVNGAIDETNGVKSQPMVRSSTAKN